MPRFSFSANSIDLTKRTRRAKRKIVIMGKTELLLKTTDWSTINFIKDI
jgi:hypothetical protein